MKERAGGEMRIEFRMRHVDNSYRWFELEAASVPGADRRNLRCVGLVREVTDAKRAQERLLHDAVHDSLSGLPNRELFLDRLAIAAKRATLEPLVRPALLFIDIDKFKTVNIVVRPDRRRQPAADDRAPPGAATSGRRTRWRAIGGDQFALLLLSQSDPRELAMLAEQVRRSLRSPINIAGQEIVLTASIGIAALRRPRRGPGRAAARGRDRHVPRQARRRRPHRDLQRRDAHRQGRARRARERPAPGASRRSSSRVLYQPIFYLPTETLAGFEALLRWEHPEPRHAQPDRLRAGGRGIATSSSSSAPTC